jgi:ribulose-5-phosphate 4-epimerase/fuculose-1-phosphate aldolase
VKASEGNLSWFDGERLVITRTGSELAGLTEDDVLEGTLDRPPPGSSSDLVLHLEMYRERGPGAVAHAHPPGTVPEGWVEGQAHGTYAHAPTLEEAVDRLVREARERG